MVEAVKSLLLLLPTLPYDSDEPPLTKEVRDVIDYCHSKKKQLIIGCDANAHHTLWGSTGSNPKGESLMEFLVSSKLNILNHGNEPNFVVCNRKKIIDLTLVTNKIVNLVSNWNVSDEPPLSDHRYICFQIGNISINKVTFRNSRRTNWDSYKDDLKVNLETLPRRKRTIKNIGRTLDQLQRSIISFYYHNCPAKTTSSSGTTPWWNKKMSGLRPKTRKLFNIAKKKQGSGTFIRNPLLVTIKKPKETRGGGSARRLMMYRAVPDS
jgi:hypothetical protein